MEERWARGPDDPPRAPEEYLRLLQDRIRTAQDLAQGNLERAQGKQKERYDRGTRARAFHPGDQVLVARRVLATTKGDPWQGPFPVVRVLGPLSYEVRCGRRATRLKHLHINDLKEWHPCSESPLCALTIPPEKLPAGPRVEQDEDDYSSRPGIDPGLTPQQMSDVLTVLDSAPPVFSKTPGLTHLAVHHIPTPEGKIVRNRWRPLP